MVTKHRAAITTFIAVAFVAGTIIAILQLLPADFDEEPLSHDELSRVDTKGDEVVILNKILGEDEPPSQPAVGSREQLATRGFFIKGQVMDRDTKVGIPVFDLQINRKGNKKTAKGGYRWDVVVHETVTSDKGIFSCPLQEGGLYRVTVRSSCYQKHTTEDFKLTEEDKTKELLIALDSGHGLRGVVVADATGNPVEDARVFPLTKKDQDPFLWLLRGYEEYHINATTNERGEFILRGLDLREVLLAAIHPHYTESYVEATPESDDYVELRLKKGPVIYGKAFDDDGNPISNILITVMGNQLLIPRSVLTEKDGRFRTAPVRPGRFFVRASPFSKERSKKKKPAFTTETQWVNMKDKDEEVIFGPTPDKVIWRGHLYKGSGEPVSGGMVEVFPTSTVGKNGKINQYGKTAYFFRTSSTASCNEEGFFEFIKLVPGTYRVKVYFPEKSLEFFWGEIKLDKPGLTEKDIHLSGGEIHGMVVDEITGQAVPGVQGVINASNGSAKYEYHTAVLDQDGRFHFYGLAAGEYELIPAIAGSLNRTYTCPVAESEVVKDLKLPITYGGELWLILSQFDITENNEFIMSIRPLDGGDDKEQPLQGKGKGRGKGEGGEKAWREGVRGRADWESRLTLDPGEYEVELEFLSFGMVTKRFEIFTSQTTTVEIFRYELGPAAEVFDVNGILQYEDGIPLDGAYVRIMAEEGPWQDTVETDREGRFTLTGIRPGTWAMDVWIPASGSKSGITCSDLVIPEGSKPPDPLVLVLSIGIIRGELLDASTGRSLGTDGGYWSAVLADADTQEIITRTYGDSERTEFSLVGIQEGEYRLTISMNGYKVYQSDTISLGENEILDLGRIELEPEEGE